MTFDDLGGELLPLMRARVRAVIDDRPGLDQRSPVAEFCGTLSLVESDRDDEFEMFVGEPPDQLTVRVRRDDLARAWWEDAEDGRALALDLGGTFVYLVALPGFTEEEDAS